MSKLNIDFNGVRYEIDEETLAATKAKLETHLSSVMNGSGSVIKIGDLSYNIDSTKLATATNSFISHLGTISGSGKKVVVGGVEYGIDSTKIASAMSELENAFGKLESSEDNSSSNEIITFSIRNSTFQCVNGMTWREFVNSEYNQVIEQTSYFTSLYISTNSICDNHYDGIVCLGDEIVRPDNIIIANANYTLDA